MEDYFCSICKYKANSKKSFEQHTKSFSHSEKVMQESEKQNEMKEKQERKKWETQIKKELDPKLENFLNEVYKYLGSKKKSEQVKKEFKDLSEEMIDLYTINRPSKSTQMKRKLLCSFLNNLVKHVYPNAKLEVYLSFFLFSLFKMKN